MTYCRLTSTGSRRSGLQATGSGLFLPKHCSILQGIEAKFELRGLGSLGNYLGQKKSCLGSSGCPSLRTSLVASFSRVAPGRAWQAHVTVTVLIRSHNAGSEDRNHLALRSSCVGWRYSWSGWVRLYGRWKVPLNSTVLIWRPYFYLIFVIIYSFIPSFNKYLRVRQGHHVVQP